ncbi:MAG: HIT family protein [Bdellovibrionota bacterium]
MRVERWRDGKNWHAVHDFKHTILVVGDHQFFEGYCQLITKEHARELHELDSTVQRELFEELMTAGKAVAEAFRPWKMNYSCYGNVVQHIHWHLIPRSSTEADKLANPWSFQDEFAKHKTTKDQAREIIDRLRKQLFRSPYLV